MASVTTNMLIKPIEAHETIRRADSTTIRSITEGPCGTVTVARGALVHDIFDFRKRRSISF